MCFLQCSCSCGTRSLREPRVLTYSVSVLACFVDTYVCIYGYADTRCVYIYTHTRNFDKPSCDIRTELLRFVYSFTAHTGPLNSCQQRSLGALKTPQASGSYLGLGPRNQDVGSLCLLVLRPLAPMVQKSFPTGS